MLATGAVRAKTDPAARFWGYVEKRGPDECWPWTAALRPQPFDYGVFHDEHETLWRAHRYAFFLTHGFVPKVVRHTCDNPPCCNHAHLVHGKKKDNTADMYARGRAPIGMLHGIVKLTDDQVREIRASSELQRVIAERFGVDRAHISLIRSRKIWKHVA